MRRLERRVRRNERIDTEDLPRGGAETLGQSGRTEESSLLLNRPRKDDTVI